ncbi:hypothetical protein [Elizabethkingia miricola]|uniref:hypothetical protein n=1 Tax=Elizabethkingia miricola TaxID=172045 RepID=UPI00389180C2
MNKLQELIRTLRAFTILIIENDFSYIDDPKLILGHLSILPEKNFNHIINEFEKENLLDLSSKLKSFIEKWRGISNHDMKMLEDMGIDYIDKYLEKIGNEEIIEDSLDALSNLISEDHDDKVKSIFLKNGIFEEVTVPKYKEIFEHVRLIDECRIIIWKNSPTSHEWDNFKSVIENAISETQSSFCLSIIDKNLGGGANEGKELIKRLIKEHKNDQHFNHICCLYTSTATSNDLVDYDDYFVQEISKNSENSIDDIVYALTQSAYAEVFNSLRVKALESIEQTMNIVLKNQKNIKYIISESHKEGIPAYDAIKYWNWLSIQNEFDTREVKDFRFIGSLTSLFNKNYLNDNPRLAQVSNELKLLNTYELFDYNVNKKHLSIAPGDIWEIKGNYYILVGQLCDLLLRGGSNKRKSKIGELFKIDFGRHSDQEHKYDIVTDKGKKVIHIDYFYRLDSDVHETIRIDISTPNICFADLSVLDLCMYNDSGDCTINVNEVLNEDIKLLLPTGKDIYYEELKKQYSDLLAQSVDQLIPILNSYESLDFSKFKFTKEGDEIVNHHIRRVCRLKGRYFDSLYNNYLNNKGRIDLNLIDNVEEEVDAILLKFELFGDETSKQEIREFNIYKTKHDKYIKLSELKVKLPMYEKLFSHALSEKLTMDSKVQYELTEEEIGIYVLQYKYHLNPKDYSAKQLFSFKDLYNTPRPKTNDTFRIEGEMETRSFIEDGHPKRKLTIEELKKGVVIFESKQKIKLLNGVLEREEYEQ